MATVGAVPVFPTRPHEGIPATGATLVLSAVVSLAALVDIAVSGRPGHFSAAVFVLGCGAVAARLVRRDLSAALLAPPLVFAAVAVIAVQFVARGGSVRAYAVDEVLGLGAALGSGAPALFAGLALSGAVAAARLLGEHRARASQVGDQRTDDEDAGTQETGEPEADQREQVLSGGAGSVSPQPAGRP